MPPHYYIYSVTDLRNGKVYYGKRMSKVPPELDTKYMGSSKALRKELLAAGVQSFRKDIIAVCESDQKLTELERLVVDRTVVNSTMTYNLAIGGNGFSYCQPETRAKIGARHKGVIFSAERKEKIAASKKGKPRSAECKAKVREGLTRYYEARKAEGLGCISEETRQKLNARRRQAETRAQQSQAMKQRPGKPLTEQAKEKLRVWNTGRKLSEETKRKQREAWTKRSPEKRAELIANLKYVPRPQVSVAATRHFTEVKRAEERDRVKHGE